MTTPQLEQGQHTFEVGGLTVAYEVRGHGPVCVVHSGGPGVRSNYLRMPEIERFATMVYIDPVGTGSSSRLSDGNYSMGRYAQVAHQLIEGALGGKAYFLGHSHGGFVGLQLALDHPDDLLGLVVYGGAPLWSPEAMAEAAVRMSAFVGRFPEDEDARGAEAAFLEEDPYDDAETFLRWLRRLLPAYFADPRNESIDLQQISQDLAIDFDPRRQPAEWDVRDRLKEIGVPTLVLVGRYDWICGPRWAALIWQEVESATLVPFDRSGHYIHLEEPELFASSLRQFLTC